MTTHDSFEAEVGELLTKFMLDQDAIRRKYHSRGQLGSVAMRVKKSREQTTAALIAAANAMAERRVREDQARLFQGFILALQTPEGRENPLVVLLQMQNDYLAPDTSPNQPGKETE